MIVVPANAGTHTAEFLSEALLGNDLHNTSAGGYGSRIALGFASCPG
jgi:hypothetical protein